MLVVKDLTKYYKDGEIITHALRGINFFIDEGEFVAITGPSGSGKTTLLNMIGCLDTPTAGSVEINGQSTGSFHDDQLTVFRRQNIGFIFQNYNLIPMLTVEENIMLPTSLDGKKLNTAYIDTILTKLDIKHKYKQFPNTLSGGQQQRVAIARALSSHPKVLLADEPTGNLDQETSQEVMNLLRAISKEFKQTTLVVTHDPNIAKQADRIIRIVDGNIA